MVQYAKQSSEALVFNGVGSLLQIRWTLLLCEIQSERYFTETRGTALEMEYRIDIGRGPSFVRNLGDMMVGGEEHTQIVVFEMTEFPDSKQIY